MFIRRLQEKEITLILFSTIFRADVSDFILFCETLRTVGSDLTLLSETLRLCLLSFSGTAKIKISFTRLTIKLMKNDNYTLIYHVSRLDYYSNLSEWFDFQLENSWHLPYYRSDLHLKNNLIKYGEAIGRKLFRIFLKLIRS